MSITEILQETSSKYINKDFVGDTVIHGIMIGIVAENGNKDFPGMVRVRIPTRDKNQNVLQWMKVATIMSGKSWGGYFIPEVGDEVVVAFEQGNIHNAYVIGSVYKNDSSIVSNNYTDENYKKSILTKGGNKIDIDDTDDKQKIVITTKKEHTVALNDEKNLISIKNKDGKNSIEMNTEKETINIKAGSKLIIDINGTKIEMLGDSSKVTVKCGSFNIKADQNVNIKGQNVKIESTTLNLSASASGKLSTDGALQLKGSIIKLG